MFTKAKAHMDNLVARTNAANKRVLTIYDLGGEWGG